MFSKSQFTHFRAAIKTAFYCNQKVIKNKLGIRGRPTNRVMHAGMDQAVERYTRICRTLLAHIPNPEFLQGAVASEIGCGDCFAAADMILGLGAKHVHLVEFLPLELTKENQKALQALVGKDGLPNRGELFDTDETPQLNAEKATYHQGFLENIKIPQKVDFLYSFDVLEHVEDLEGFFSYCGEVVRPGGTMVHKFDLSGHGLFEDPMPPLDFQTFPRWLFDFIFPKYHRAVGNFADQFVDAMKLHGFGDIEIVPIRVADPEYLEAIWPHLRKDARSRSRDTIKLLDLVVIAKKKP
jgi:SAM-dependent methyltransferase